MKATHRNVPGVWVLSAAMALLGDASAEDDLRDADAPKTGPASGFIHTMSYGVDKNDKVRGQRRETRIWFRGSDLRREGFIGKHLVTLSLRGKHSWYAYPAAGRFAAPMHREATKRPKSYPEDVQETFRKVFGSRTRVEKTDINGLPAWRYAWRQEGKKMGCIRISAMDVSYWVHASPTFPTILRYESSQGGRKELVEMKMDCEVPDDLFSQPGNLKAIKPMELPQKKLYAEVETFRKSYKYGWSVQTSQTLRGDGETVLHSHVSRKVDSNGRRTTFEPEKPDLAHADAKALLESWLRLPDWYAAAKERGTTWSGLKADVIANVVSGLPDTKWCVVDHPVLGTVCVRKETSGGHDVSTMRVSRITVGDQTWAP